MKAFFLLTASIIISILHADGLAEYLYYTDHQGHIALKLEIDQNELKYYRIGMDCQKSSLPDFCVTNYLESHANFKINEEKVNFEFESSTTYNGHVILNFKSEKVFKAIHNIQIKNTCFFEINPKFKNRIRLDISQYQKSFLLTKGKDLIVLK